MLNPKKMEYYNISRLKRSAKQNIKLGSIAEGTYTVYGSTGTEYTVKTEPIMNCTCIDYNKNKRYCKHIYFIFLNVYKIIPELDKCYTPEELKELHTAFYKCKMESVRNEDDPCSICFETIHSPFVCKVCKNGFHQTCINDMFRFSKKSNCPLCRSDIKCSDIDELIKKIELI